MTPASSCACGGLVSVLRQRFVALGVVGGDFRRTIATRRFVLHASTLCVDVDLFKVSFQKVSLSSIYPT